MEVQGSSAERLDPKPLSAAFDCGLGAQDLGLCGWELDGSGRGFRV